MQDIEVIESAAGSRLRAGPWVRARLLGELAASRPRLLGSLPGNGIGRQKVNHHLKALEDTRRRSCPRRTQYVGITERVLQASAASYVAVRRLP